MSAIKKPPVARILLIQVVMLLLLTVTGWLWSGTVSAYSVFLGGLISVIPNAYFAYKVTRFSGARSTERMVQSAYIGEVIKLALTAAGFALVFTQVDPVHVPGLFYGFISVYVAGLLGLVWVFRH